MQNMQYIDFCIFCIQNCTFHSIFFAYSNNIVYIFAYFTCNCILFAYLCIFLRDPFQLALLLAVSVPFQQALQQQVRVHSSLLASSCRFARVWRPRGAAQASLHARPTWPQSCKHSSSSSPLCLCLHCSCSSLAPVAGQSNNIGRIYMYKQHMKYVLNMHFMHIYALYAEYT